MLKIKRLTSDGIAHLAALLVIVVAVAAVGTYILVKSNANSIVPIVPLGYIDSNPYSSSCSKSGTYGVGSADTATNKCVHYIQWTLVNKTACGSGIKNSGGIDGVYGSGTKQSVTCFQKNQSLTADGVVGTQTWSKLVTKNLVKQ